MAESKKVITALDAALVQMHGCGRYTPEDVDELEKAAWDALKLLEAQEPVKPVMRTAHAQGADDVWYECSKCGGFLSVNWNGAKVCKKCGRPVKWDG